MFREVPTLARGPSETASTSRTSALLDSPGFVRRWCRIILCLLGVMEAISSMYATNPDAIQYLDLGSAFWRGDSTWTNGLWSPLYGIVDIGLVHLLRLSPRWEFPVCHLTNLIFYILALFAFEFFLVELIGSVPVSVNFSPKLINFWFLLGFGVFLEWNLGLIRWLSPDLAVNAALFCALGLILSIKTRPGGSVRYWLLGGVLGAGYLAKAPLLIIGMLLLGAAVFYLRPTRLTMAGMVQTCAVFGSIAAIYVVPLSLHLGHMSTGESGRLNYAWHVQGVTYIDWQGDPVHGRPLHPTRLVHSDPQVFEFAEPIHATYAAYYDPSYWFAGLKVPFEMGPQLSAVLRSLKEYRWLFSWQNGILVVVFIYLCASAQDVFLPSLRAAVRPHAPLLVCCLLGLILYCLVHVERRYVTGFVTAALPMLLIGALAIAWHPNRFVRFFSIAAFVTVLASVIAIAPELGRAAVNLATWDKPATNESWFVAESAQASGLRPDDKIACIGYGFHHAYWARLASLRIVAEIPDAQEYWVSPVETRREIDYVLAASGVRAIVAKGAPSNATSEGWRRVGSTETLIHWLPRNEDRFSSTR